MPEPQQPLRNLVLDSAVLNRDAASRSPRGAVRRLLADPATRVLELRGDRARVVPEGNGFRLALRAPDAADLAFYEADGVVLYLGRADLGGAEGSPTSDERSAVAVLRPSDESADASTESGEDWQTLRGVGLDLPGADVALYTTAVALRHWHAGHTHCPRCGGPTLPRQAGWVRECLADGSQHFPRTDPAVIMAVIDADDRLLLARGSRWGGNHRSVLAGFVEPGETFESAVARETFEESGVVVDEVTYVGNQPWPFPASLMIGFMARARTTELTPEAGEIEEIAWYSRQDVRDGLAAGTLRLPGRLSIARGLIERWYGGELPEAPDGTQFSSTPSPGKSASASQTPSEASAGTPSDTTTTTATTTPKGSA